MSNKIKRSFFAPVHNLPLRPSCLLRELQNMYHLHAFMLVVLERTIRIRFLKNYANYNRVSFH